MTTQLLTKYILTPFWVRILIFLIFYFIVRELHFIDSDFGIAECMPRKKSAKVLYETKEEFKQALPAIAESESKEETVYRLEKQIKQLINERNGLRKNVSKVMKDSNHSLQIKDTEIKKLKREVHDLQHKSWILPEAKRISVPVIPHAEPIAEIIPSDVTAVSLENENIRLQNELQQLINTRQTLIRQIEESRSLRDNYISLKNENAQLRAKVQELHINSQLILKKSSEEQSYLRQSAISLETQKRELQNEVERLRALPQAKEASRGMLTRILNRFRSDRDLRITEEEYNELKRAFNKYTFEKMYKSRDMK